MNQRDRVFCICKGSKWRALWDIRQEIYDKFHVIDSETAISARLREFSQPRRGYIKEVKRPTKKGEPFKYRLILQEWKA